MVSQALLCVFWCPTLSWSFGHHMPWTGWWTFSECCNFFSQECQEFCVWCWGGRLDQRALDTHMYTHVQKHVDTYRTTKSCTYSTPNLTVQTVQVIYGYSSPGNLDLFLFADALGQPDRLRGEADENQELMKDKIHHFPLYSVWVNTFIYSIYSDRKQWTQWRGRLIDMNLPYSLCLR